MTAQVARCEVRDIVALRQITCKPLAYPTNKDGILKKKKKSMFGLIFSLCGFELRS